MKRFEYKKYVEKDLEHRGEGIMTDIIKTVGKKAAEKTAHTVGDYAGEKTGDKIIELLSKSKTKPTIATKTKPKTLTNYEVNEKLSQLLGGGKKK